MHVHCMYMYVCLSLLKRNYNLTNKSHTNLPEQHISKALANELCGSWRIMVGIPVRE